MGTNKTLKIRKNIWENYKMIFLKNNEQVL